MSEIKAFIGSTAGLVVCVAAAALGLYLIAYHLNHVLLAVPYVILLACPLMHLMHRGHHGHKHGNPSNPGKRSVSDKRGD